MLRLRPYKRSDAEIITGWIKDEVTFRKWCAVEYDSYPISAADMNYYYDEKYEFHEDLMEFTTIDDDGPVGHFTLRFTDNDKKTVKLGFLITDDSKRGKGYDRETIELGIKYAFDMLKAENVALMVFLKNTNAFGLYKSLGFEIVEGYERHLKFFGEDWDGVEMVLSK